MDPNAALAALRYAIAEAREHGACEDNEAEYEALQRVFQHAEALDGWLSGGGFLPDAWRH